MALPKTCGTVRAMLYLALVKCAMPVKRNMAARAQRTAATQVENAATPNTPATRKIRREPTRMMRTITPGIVAVLSGNIQVGPSLMRGRSHWGCSRSRIDGVTQLIGQVNSVGKHKRV